jgi:electron transport complex protein RnfD/electron transport complex protein RnfC
VEVNVMDMIIGRTGGTIGETSMLCIVIGAMILFAVGVIDYVIPFTYIITFALFVGIFGGYGFNMTYISAHLAGGGLMLGAFFMATDYVTCPITPKGRVIYGVILGLLTGIFRIFGANAEGVSFAIVITNLLVPLIEKFTIPRAFGIKKIAKKEAKKA